MNLIIWSSPAKKTHIFPGVTNEAPGCIQVWTALQEQGASWFAKPLARSSRVHFSFSDSVLRLRIQGDKAVEHEHERLKWTPLSQGLLLLFISCPFLWLWSSDLWKGWSLLPRKVLWGNGSRDKITLPAWSRMVRIPPSWYLWTKILEEWGIWHIKDSHLLWINCRLMIFNLFLISSKIHRSSHSLPY